MAARQSNAATASQPRPRIVEATKAALQLIDDWSALPEMERADFARAIAARAAWWRLSPADRLSVAREHFLRFMRAVLTAPAIDDENDDDDWPAS